MRNLKGFYFCVFSSEEISNARIINFGGDHLQRLISNNINGKYDNMITATTLCLQETRTESGDLHIDTALQKGATIALDTIKKAILVDLPYAEAKVMVVYPNSKPMLVEFFPHGLTEWYQATRPGLAGLLTNFKTSLDNHSADFNVEFIQKWGTYRANYISARNAQELKKGAVSGDIVSFKDKRIALENQLMDNLYDLSKEYKRKPEYCAVFFNQSLLLLRQRSTNDSIIYEGELMGGDTVIITNEFTNKTIFRVTNKGEFNIMACFSDSEEDACTSGVIIQKGQTEEITPAELDGQNKKFFKLTNPNPDEVCKYEIIKFLNNK